jgi:hypothetical protein
LEEPGSEEVDGASLGFFRAAFGFVLAWEVWRFFEQGWIERYYLGPEFHFTYTGFGWVRPLPDLPLHVFFVLLGLAALGIGLGLFHRLSSAAFAVGFTYVFLLEKARYLNHFYLVCLLAVLVAWLPLQGTFALDARRRGLRSTAPRWVLGLVRAQLGIVYFYAGIAKLNEDWLLRSEPLLTWLGRRTDHAVFGPLFAHPETAWFMSWSGFLLDLLAWPLLAWKRTRGLAFLALLAFHLTNAGTFGIGIFPWLMIAATTVFFEPDWPRRVPLLRRLAGPVRPSPLGVPVARGTLGPRLAVAWMVVQVLVPLRHFLYPGSVHWTEEGHAFAWHMKLRSKNADATFVVHDPASGKTWVVDPRRELLPWQARKMSGRPDMTLQYAHHLAEDYRARGFPEVEVRARVEASLNARPRQLLIDSDVDLARVRPSLGPSPWIVPLEPLVGGSATP